MRDTFRGKRTDTGEWVEGFYLQFRMTPETDSKDYIQPIKENGTLGIICEVIPDTVGQYTGLTDKNSISDVIGNIYDNPELLEEGAE